MPGLDVHAGIWLALERAGIRSTVNSGTSAGAFISALDSAGFSAEYCATEMSRLTDRDVRSPRLLWRLRGLFNLIDYYLGNDPIWRLLCRYIPESGREVEKPVHIWATRELDNALTDLSDPQVCTNLRAAVLASMAIDGIFPLVKIGEYTYADGGYRANLPLPQSWSSFDEIWLLIAAAPPESYRLRAGMMTRLLRSIDRLMRDQIQDVLDRIAASSARHKVRVIWPDLARPAGLLHFDHTLIERAYQYTREALKHNEVSHAL